MPDAMTLVLLSLATFTASFMLCKSDWFTGLRTRFGCYDYGPVTYPNGEPMPISSLGRWVACPICMSLFPVAPIMLILVFIHWQLVAWFGITGAAILMFRWRSW